MNQVERQSRILERVGDARAVDVAGLAASLGVSGATIRRDLSLLARRGLLVRTHGGAAASGIADERPTHLKAVLRQAEKYRIGQAATSLVTEGAVLGMTGGTTTLQVARAVADVPGITVITNAVNIAAELLGRRNVHLVVVGGIARPSGELVGPAAEAMMGGYHLDTAFIGVDGLTAEAGATTYDEIEAQTDLAFLRRARRVVVVTDSTKIGLVRLAAIAPLSRVHDVLTDDGARPEDVAALRAAGARVQVV